MWFFSRFRRDHEALERARRADAEADRHLDDAKVSAVWARRTLAMNHLTERFYADLRHGGKP